jgi:hypothetical protein
MALLGVAFWTGRGASSCPVSFLNRTWPLASDAIRRLRPSQGDGQETDQMCACIGDPKRPDGALDVRFIHHALLCGMAAKISNSQLL